MMDRQGLAARCTVGGGDEEEDRRRLVARDAGIDVEEGDKSLGAIQSDDWWRASSGCLLLDLTTTTETKTTPPSLGGTMHPGVVGGYARGEASWVPPRATTSHDKR